MRRRLSLAFGLLVGVAASQLPEYAQQYRQRLGGAVDELHAVMAKFDADSSQAGFSRDQAIARLQADTDTFVQQRGVQAADIVARAQRLERPRQDFSTAGPVNRLIVMARDFDPAIARGAYASFEPAVPVTSEGFLAGLIGLTAGAALFRLAAVPFRRRVRVAQARQA